MYLKHCIEIESVIAFFERLISTIIINQSEIQFQACLLYHSKFHKFHILEKYSEILPKEDEVCYEKKFVL